MGETILLILRDWSVQVPQEPQLGIPDNSRKFIVGNQQPQIWYLGTPDNSNWVPEMDRLGAIYVGNWEMGMLGRLK